MFYLYILDVDRNIILFNSENDNIAIGKNLNIQSAENWKGFSETARRLSDKKYYTFWNWSAGVLDGDGNFDIRKNGKVKVLKQIRIKLSPSHSNFKMLIVCYLYMTFLCIIDYILIWNFIGLEKLNLLCRSENIQSFLCIV